MQTCTHLTPTVKTGLLYNGAIRPEKYNVIIFYYQGKIDYKSNNSF